MLKRFLIVFFGLSFIQSHAEITFVRSAILREIRDNFVKIGEDTTADGENKFCLKCHLFEPGTRLVARMQLCSDRRHYFFTTEEDVTKLINVIQGREDSHIAWFYIKPEKPADSFSAMPTMLAGLGTLFMYGSCMSGKSFERLKKDV